MITDIQLLTQFFKRMTKVAIACNKEFEIRKRFNQKGHRLDQIAVSFWRHQSTDGCDDFLFG